MQRSFSEYGEPESCAASRPVRHVARVARVVVYPLYLPIRAAAQCLRAVLAAPRIALAGCSSCFCTRSKPAVVVATWRFGQIAIEAGSCSGPSGREKSRPPRVAKSAASEAQNELT